MVVVFTGEGAWDQLDMLGVRCVGCWRLRVGGILQQGFVNGFH